MPLGIARAPIPFVVDFDGENGTEERSIWAVDPAELIIDARQPHTLCQRVGAVNVFVDDAAFRRDVPLSWHVIDGGAHVAEFHFRPFLLYSSAFPSAQLQYTPLCTTMQ